MSVLQSQQTQSKAEFVNTAREIYKKTITFLSFMSARYSRLVAQPIATLAAEVLNHCEKANSIFPKGEPNVGLRKSHILEARASLNALDVQLTYCLDILLDNPQGAFNSQQTGKTISADRAKEKIGNASQTLGNLIDEEKSLLEGQSQMLLRVIK